ncbi:hypothetical protein [Mesobacillus foraminis]|uniref:Uncharacterized protein n=1 Tax=Mesobacillus foraminis TaxID=279826 RepID=A0A4R2BIN7_9BACI|nr:hypothetical protein [Mesobacillus foraminis]TCN26483.1 hypothetical protein EV146_1034 [Mesobacillus foraminis]
MNWGVILFFASLAICVLLIIITLVTLPQLGNERKNFIKMKAQSYAFTVVIGMLLIEMIENVYLTFWTDRSYEGINPFIFLLTISIIYLITLLYTKRKYGG